MKIDREKFLAAALLLGATGVGCKKTAAAQVHNDGAHAKSAASAAHSAGVKQSGTGPAGHVSPTKESAYGPPGAE